MHALHGLLLRLRLLWHTLQGGVHSLHRLHALHWLLHSLHRLHPMHGLHALDCLHPGLLQALRWAVTARPVLVRCDWCRLL